MVVVLLLVDAPLLVEALQELQSMCVVSCEKPFWEWQLEWFFAIITQAEGHNRVATMTISRRKPQKPAKPLTSVLWITLSLRATTIIVIRKMENSELEMQERVIEVLKTVFDPEIPVNIYDLGLIYRIEFNEDNTELSVDMTLTAPNCPAADFIVEDVRQKLETITGIEKVEVNLVFEPEWDKEMMSEEAKMELGFL